MLWRRKKTERYMNTFLFSTSVAIICVNRSRFLFYSNADYFLLYCDFLTATLIFWYIKALHSEKPSPRCKICFLTISNRKNYEKSKKLLKCSSEITEHDFHRNSVWGKTTFKLIFAIFSSSYFAPCKPGFWLEKVFLSILS